MKTMNNKHRYRLDRFLIKVVLLFQILILAACASSGGNDAREFPVIHTKQLLLSSRAFPSTWQADPCAPACHRSERPEYSTRTFGRIGIPGHVIQDVYVFPSNDAAAEHFQQYRAALFTPLRSPDKTFEQPSAVMYQSTLADEFALGCGQQVVNACRAILRYRNYVVEFYFDLDDGQDDGLQLRDIEPILQAMDAHITQEFQQSLVLVYGAKVNMTLGRYKVVG